MNGRKEVVMASAVVAVFDQFTEAQSTVNELLVAGFDQNEVKLNAEDKPQLEREEAQPSGVKGFFQDLFGKGKEDDDEIRLYDEAVRHGNYVVTAIASTDERSELASEVMSHHHPIDLDERSGEWIAGEGMKAPSEASSIPVIKEEVKIGKREVPAGGVRIFKNVYEVPVEEDVTLREERVTVERVPVDKPADEADLGAFKEGSMEFRERTEEPVISKEARVVEEVRVGKDVSERTETIRETARQSDVKVERTGDDPYRAHWEQTYANQGGRYEDWAPGYECGSTAASSELYRGRPFEEIEPQLRTEWEGKHPDSAWERFKDAVKRAFTGK
jgi:uncharacterized protein (TIGR02271 family)